MRAIEEKQNKNISCRGFSDSVTRGWIHSKLSATLLNAVQLKAEIMVTTG